MPVWWHRESGLEQRSAEADKQTKLLEPFGGLGAWAAGLRGDPRNVKWRMGADYKASGLKENSRTTVSAAHVGGCPVVAPVAWASGDLARWLVGSPTELAVMVAADIASKPHPI